MKRARIENISLLVFVAAVVTLILTAGCDREDNEWNLFDPSRKMLLVDADTLTVIEGAPEGQTFEVWLQMVPEDTVSVIITGHENQIVFDPDTLHFIPIGDEWADRLKVEIEALDDDIAEGTHADSLSFEVISRDPDYAAMGSGIHVPVLVVDNDGPGVYISETQLNLVETVGGVLAEIYRVKLLSQPTADVTITPTVVPAEPSLHLVPTSLTFTPDNWDQEQEIRLWIELDETDADNLTLVVNHTAASTDPNFGPGLAIPSIDLTIYDDTLPPLARVHFTTPGADTLDEGNLAAQVSVTVSLDRPSEEMVVVNLSTLDGSAVGGADFVALDQDLTFMPGGGLTRNVIVSALNDNVVEPDETFEVILTEVQHVIIGDDDRLTLNIADDDQTGLTLSVVPENEDAGAAHFVVTMPFVETVPVDFTFVTSDETATEGTDYEAVNKTFTLAPGQTQRTIPVVYFADNYHEADETFTASLTNLSANAQWTQAPVVGTILNDDPQAIAFADITVLEGAGMATFTIEMLAAYDVPLNLVMRTLEGDGVAPGAGQNDALSGVDFTGVNNETWVIPPFTTTASYQVSITPDTQAEKLTETFRLAITTGDQPGFTGLTAECLIEDDDQPIIRVADVLINEIDPFAVFTLEILNAGGTPVTSAADIDVRVQTLDQTATAGLDYDAFDQVLTIPAFQPGTDVAIPITDDLHDDDGEIFILRLSEPVNTLLDTVGVDPYCAITDNEFPSINIGASLALANEGTTVDVTVSLTTPRQSSTTFDLAQFVGSTGGHTVDYVFSGTGPQVIPPFQTQIVYSIPYIDDQVPGEGDEFFQLVISSPNVAPGVMDLTLTIADAPELSIAAASATEGSDAQFPVTLSAVSTADLTFNVQFASGTASVVNDIDSSGTGPFTITAGSISTTVDVPAIAGDGGDQASEDFVVTLINPTNATLSGFNSATGTIFDGDPPIMTFGPDVTEIEGNNIVFDVNLTWVSEATVQFNVFFTDGTAVGVGVDYTSSGIGPFTITPGLTTTTVTVPTSVDGIPELALEDFTITLSPPTNAVLGGRSSALGLIQDADQPVLTIPAGDTTVEGGTLSFTIQMDRVTVVPVLFDLSFSDGSTQGASDFTPAGPGPFSMMPGTTDTTITVTTVQDGVFETQEAFIIQLTGNPVNAIVGLPNQATGTINDDD